MEMKEIFNQLKTLQAELEEKANQLPLLNSYYDSQISDLLHYIENNKLNAPQISKLIKKLKICREERRKVKEEYAILQSVMNSFKFTCKEFPESLNADNYTVRTNILEEFGYEKNSKMHFKKLPPPEIDKVEMGALYTELSTEILEDIALDDGCFIFMSKPGTKTAMKFKTFNKAAFHALKIVRADKNGNISFDEEIVRNIVGLSKVLKAGGGMYLGLNWRIGKEISDDTTVEEESQNV